MIREKLKKLVLNITDGEHGTVKDDPKSNYYLLSNKNLINGYIEISNNDRKISKTSFENIRKRTDLSKNDVVIATVGTIGKPAIIKDDIINYDFQRSVGIIKCNIEKIIPEYLYYYLKLPYVQKQLINRANGAVQKCLYIGDLENLYIDYCDIKDQQKISSVLSILDSKIELNNKINFELEQMAKTLYNYWFVQFDFPNKNGKPYKTSGGKMIYNKELKRKIPDGWGMANLFKNPFTQIIKPGIQNFEGEKRYLATADINDREIRVGSLITFKNRESRANMQPIENSVWFAKMKASRKHLFIGEFGEDIIENDILSTGFMGLVCKSIAFEFIASFISSDMFENIKDTISHGATMQGIGNEDLKFIKIVIPNNDVLSNFKLATETLYKKMDMNRKESQKLAELRDWLLPMLMNGQVKVK